MDRRAPDPARTWTVADKLTPLVLDALTLAATRPDGAPLYSSKGEPGLFPPTAAAKPAAQKCLTDGLLNVVGSDARGKQTRELYAATAKGRTLLLELGSPKQVLDDFVRVLEERRGEVRELLATAGRMAASLDGLKDVVAAMLPQVREARVEVEAHGRPSVGVRSGSVDLLEPLTALDLGGRVLDRLREWSATTDTARDCPLPDLLRGLDPQPTPGQFHDALRRLHDSGRVYLHPWTGPLYALPEPAAALLVGHEVAYYASLRQ